MMKAGIIAQIVELLLSFIRDFFRKARLGNLNKELNTQREVTHAAASKSDILYDDFMRDYDEYNRQRSQPGYHAVEGEDELPVVRQPAKKVRSAGTGSKKDNRRAKARKASTRRSSSRTAKTAKRNTKRK